MSVDYRAAVVSFGVSLVLESSLALLSWRFSRRVFLSGRSDYPSHRMKLWHTTAAALFPAVVAPAFALPGLLAMVSSQQWSTRNLLLQPPNVLLWRALGVSVAHFWFDLVVMLFHVSDFSRAMGPALFKQMLFHHAASALAWPYAVSRHRCACPVAYYIITELSNVFLNLRWFFAETGNAGTLRLLVDFSFFLSYTLVRIVPVFVAAYLLLCIDWIHYYRNCNWLDLLLTTLTVVPFGLNLFWYNIIVRNVRKKLGGGTKHSSSSSSRSSARIIEDDQHYATGTKNNKKSS